MQKTFDNPALMGDLLSRTVGEMKKFGFKVIGSRRDSHGLFAFILQAQNGFPLCLCAKGSELYRGDILSVQLDLVQNWHGPLCIAWLSPNSSKPQFYVFDPTLILLEKKFLNDRFDSTMINFSVNLGRLWYPEDESIESVWAKARSKQQLLGVTI